MLKDAGPVIDEADCARRVYSLHDSGLEAVTEYVAHVWGDAAARFRLVAENTRREPTDD